jgi:hypothetical protein
MRHQQPSRALALHGAVADEQPHEPMLPIASFGELILTLVLFFSGLASVPQQVREQHTTGPPVTQDAAANQQAQQSTIAVTTFG